MRQGAEKRDAELSASGDGRCGASFHTWGNRQQGVNMVRPECPHSRPLRYGDSQAPSDRCRRKARRPSPGSTMNGKSASHSSRTWVGNPVRPRPLPSRRHRPARLYEARTRYILDTNRGLTKTYTDRLFALNTERAAEESKLGNKKTAKRSRGKGGARSSGTSDGRDTSPTATQGPSLNRQTRAARAIAKM